MPQARSRPAPAQDDTTQSPLRAAHPGKWLAWAQDQSRIIATGETAAEVRAAAEQAGEPQFIYDWVPPIVNRQTTELA